MGHGGEACFSTSEGEETRKREVGSAGVGWRDGEKRITTVIE